jgi:hypothetical protein
MASAVTPFSVRFVLAVVVAVIKTATLKPVQKVRGGDGDVMSKSGRRRHYDIGWRKHSMQKSKTRRYDRYAPIQRSV